jgi:hypothetical protein
MTEPTLLNSNPQLTELATRIKNGHAQVIDAAKNVVLKAIAVGTDLIAAKKSADMKHGMWLPWLKDNCGVSERHATRYMLLAMGKHKLTALKSDIVSDLTLTGALRLVQGKNKEPDGAGEMGRYEKAQATLIKRLNGLSADDVVDAAESTIAALQGVIDKVKKPLSNVA